MSKNENLRNVEGNGGISLFIGDWPGHIKRCNQSGLTRGTPMHAFREVKPGHPSLLRRPIWTRGQLMCNGNSLVFSRPYASFKVKTGRREILTKFNLVHPSSKDGRGYYRPSVLKEWTRLLHYKHVSTGWENTPSLVKSNHCEMQTSWII